MYSILRKVDNYIKRNNIYISGVEISASYLPTYVNKSILNEVRSFRDDFFNRFYSKVTLSYDNQGRLYMLVHDLRKRKNIVIVDDNNNNNNMVDVNFKVDKVVLEKDLIRNSCMLRYVERYMNDVKKNIEIDNKDKSKRYKDILEYEVLQKTIKAANKQLVNNKKDIFKIIDCTNSLHVSTLKIIDYIDYLNDYYKKYVLVKKK